MLITEHELLKDEIQAWTKTYGRDRSALIPILQETQARYAHLSDFALQQIADALNLHPVEVYGVASFYRFLDTRVRGRFILRLCRTISCDMAGKEAVARQLQNDLGIAFGETTPDRQFTLEWAHCLGMCDQGPALLVNERVYTRITPEQVHDILQECRRRSSSVAVSDRVEAPQ